MKWRRVKPNPCEFFWRKIFRGPWCDTPSTSPGHCQFSLDDATASLRPLACGWQEMEQTFKSITDTNRKQMKCYCTNLEVHDKDHFQESLMQLCEWLWLQPQMNTFKGSVSGWMWASVLHSWRTLPRNDQGKIPPTPGISQRLPLSKKEALFSQTPSPIITFITLPQQ